MTTEPMTTETQETAARVTSIYVTIEDVRAAVEELAGGDPTAIGAAKIREHLGRGGMSTIQKFITALRDEKREAEALPAPEEGARVIPDYMRPQVSAVIEDILQKATAMAQNVVSGHINALTAERDNWRTRAEETARDLDEQCGVVETQAAALVSAGEAAEKIALEAEATKAALEAVLAEKDGEIEGLKNQAAALVTEHMARVKEMEHQAETAALKWEVERQTVRSMNEDLNAKLRDAEVERDKIIARIDQIQRDADARVSKIEAEAKEEVAQVEAEAKRVLDSVQARHNEEMTRAQDQAAKELRAVERERDGAKLEADAARKTAESLKEEVAALKARIAELEKVAAPKKEKKA